MIPENSVFVQIMMVLMQLVRRWSTAAALHEVGGCKVRWREKRECLSFIYTNLITWLTITPRNLERLSTAATLHTSLLHFTEPGLALLCVQHRLSYRLNNSTNTALHLHKNEEMVLGLFLLEHLLLLSSDRTIYKIR